MAFRLRIIERVEWSDFYVLFCVILMEAVPVTSLLHSLITSLNDALLARNPTSKDSFRRQNLNFS